MENFKLIEIYLEDVGLPRSRLVNRFKHSSLCILLLLHMAVVLNGIPILSLETPPEFAKGSLGWCAIFVMDCVYVGLMTQAPNFYIFIDETRDLIRKRMERSDLKFTYEKMKKRNKIFVKTMHKFLLGDAVGPLIALLVYTLFIHFTRGLNSDDYLLLIPIWLPFDWKSSPQTYFFAFVLEILTIFVMAKIGCPVMGIMVEAFLVLCELNNDIKREIAALNGNWKMNQNQVELMQKLKEIIWFNARYNECISSLTGIFEPLIISNLVYSLFSICLTFLMLDSELVVNTAYSYFNVFSG